jgi:hypothetical protein
MADKPLRAVTFHDRNGRVAGKVKVRETGVNPRGNAHYSTRRPDGPVCGDCGAPFEPVCSSYGCPGRKVPVAMIRSEKADAGTKRYPGHPDLIERKPHREARRPKTPRRPQKPQATTAQLAELAARFNR